MSAGYHVKVRVGVVLFKDEKLLLARQNNQPFWVLPGGTLELGEGLVETAIRELMEEAQLKIDVVNMLYIGDFIRHPATPEGPIRQSLDICFLGRYLGGTLVMTEDENLNEMDFFSLDEVKERTIQPKSMGKQLLEDWESGKLDTMLNAGMEIPSGISSLYLGKYS